VSKVVDTHRDARRDLEAIREYTHLAAAPVSIPSLVSVA